MSKRRAGSISLGAAALLATSFVSHAARADWEPDTHRSAVGGDFYPWHSPDLESTTFPLVVFANIEAVETFFIDIYAPFTFTVDPYFLGPDVIGGIGNPHAFFRYAPHHGPVRWWIGGGLGAPVSSVDDRDWQLANIYASAALAAYDVYLWIPNYMPIVATGGADIRVADFVSLQFASQGMNFIRVRDDRNVFGLYVENDGFELGLQSRAGVEFRDEVSGVGGGFHLKLVYFPTSDGDNAQFSVEPFFGYTGSHFFVRFGLIFAADEPLGPPFGDDGDNFGVFSQHGTIGGSW